MSLISIGNGVTSAALISALNNNYNLINNCSGDDATLTEIVNTLIGDDLIDALNDNNDALNILFPTTVIPITIGMRGSAFNSALNSGYINLFALAEVAVFEDNIDKMAFWINEEDNIIGSGAEINPIVIFTTDDAHISNYTIIAPYLDTKGIKYSIFLTHTPGSINAEKALSLHSRGHEIAAHAYIHPEGEDPYYETYSDADLRDDMTLLTEWIESLGVPYPVSWCPPQFSALYPNVRRVGSEFWDGLRFGVYNHNNSWDKTERTAIGILEIDFTDAVMIYAKQAVDVCYENKSILITICHSVAVGAETTNFQGFIDYILAKGIEMTTFKILSERIKVHQGHYVDKIKNINLLTILFEQRSLGENAGHIIFDDTLANVTVAVANVLKNEFDYKVGFYTDEADAAFKYAVNDDNFRAYLQSEDVNSVYDMIEREAAFLYANHAFVSDLKDFGFEYFTSLGSMVISAISNLTGVIPYTIGSMSRMSTLQIVNCKISGSIPIEIAKLIDLTNIVLTGNELTGYEKGAFSVHQSRLNFVNISNNKLTEQAVNDILCDMRDMVELQKNYDVTWDPPTPSYTINLSGGTNAAPSGLGATAKYELQNAITELGGTVDWTVTTN